MSEHLHQYSARVVWEGNRGNGTATYTGYGRDYHVDVDGKASLAGSADAQFRGDAARYNPEDLFVAAIVGCHMLSYLALCARRGVCVLAYEDRGVGDLVFDARGGGRFECVTLRPIVTIDGRCDDKLALVLHEEAHATCFIASSCNTRICVEPTIHKI